MGVRAFWPSRRSQSISSVRAEAPTFDQPHSSTSNVQSPELPAAVCGAPELIQGLNLINSMISFGSSELDGIGLEYLKRVDEEIKIDASYCQYCPTNTAESLL